MDFLFSDMRYSAYKFPKPQYLGAKYLCRDWIGEDLSLEGRTVLDAFGGSQSMAYYFKQQGARVLTNDFMAFNHSIGLALVENNSEKLVKNDLEILFSENPSSKDFNLISRLYSGLFFSISDAAFLDAFRGNVEKLSTDYKKALALTVMNRTLCRKVPMGHFGHTRTFAYASDEARIKRNPSLIRPIQEMFLESLVEYNAAVFDNGEANQSYNEDTIELLSKLSNIDVIYFDPPYCDSHSDYQGFYHLLETYTMYWKNKQFVNGIKRYDPKKTSLFEKKQTIISGLDLLCQKSENIPVWVFSYNDRSFPSVQEFVELVRKYRHVEIKERRYANSRGGKGSVAGSSEVLITARS